MHIRAGDICQIRIHTQNGEKIVKGLLVEQNEKEQLWLLVCFMNPDQPDDSMSAFPLTTLFGGKRDLGYSDISGGNLIITTEKVIERVIGFVSERILSGICCDIFDSKFSWKLERLRKHRSTGINFWINLNPYVGQIIPGMRRQ